MAPDTSGHPESDVSIEIGNPARCALADAWYIRPEQLSSVTEAEILQLHEVGPKGRDMADPTAFLPVWSASFVHADQQ